MAALLAAIQTQEKLRQQLTRIAVAAATAPFIHFTGWWDPAKVDKAIADVARVLRPTQQQMARVTDAYLARAVSTMTGRTVAPAGAVDVTALRRVITDDVARQLVAGTRTPAFVVLGEFDPNTGRIVAAPTMNTPAPMVIPEPAPGTGRAATTGSGTATRNTSTVGSRAGSSDLRARAEEIRARAREQAQALQATRAGRQPATRTVPTRVQQQPVVRTTTVDGVTPTDPYGRVAEQYRYQVVAEGVPEDVAHRRALVRIEAVAQTDVTLAVREQVRRTLGRIRGVTGYRRILHPELTESGPCGLCVVAADRVYHVEDLHPLHDRCVCGVLPIIGNLDPGLVLNSNDLDAIYGAAGSTGGGRRQGGALKKIRVALAEHGELGPTLVDADQRFRGPVEVARTRHPDREVRDRARLAAFEGRLDILLRRQRRGDDVGAAVQWQTQRVEQLRQELGTTTTASAPAPVVPVRRTVQTTGRSTR